MQHGHPARHAIDLYASAAALPRVSIIEADQSSILGQMELTIPVFGRHGSVGVLSLDLHIEPEEWPEVESLWLGGLLLFAHRIQAACADLKLDRRADTLTKREIDCLNLAAEGLKAKQIAANLDLSEQTVTFYLSRARLKLGAGNTVQAVARAASAGVLYASAVPISS